MHYGILKSRLGLRRDLDRNDETNEILSRVLDEPPLAPELDGRIHWQDLEKKPFIKIFLQVKNNPAYQVCGTDPHGICSLIHTFNGQYILMLQHICAKFG
jgi:hypothetical protein